jgi:hypothetical protein
MNSALSTAAVTIPHTALEYYIQSWVLDGRGDLARTILHCDYSQSSGDGPIVDNRVNVAVPAAFGAIAGASSVCPLTYCHAAHEVYGESDRVR